jgi:hypothetical protein
LGSFQGNADVTTGPLVKWQDHFGSSIAALLPFDRSDDLLASIPSLKHVFQSQKNSLTNASVSLYKWGHLAGEVCILYMKIFDSDFR